MSANNTYEGAVHDKADDSIKNTNDNNNNGDQSIDSPTRIRRVRALRRTKTTDVMTNDEPACRRKFGVVQISFRCSTSDYSSDENVHETQSVEFINYNTTICHVKTGRIKETYHINVSSK